MSREAGAQPYDEDRAHEERAPEAPDRGIGLIATIGLGLVAVVAAQVAASIIEGFAPNAGQIGPNVVETDFLHRLGFPFGSLGPTTMLLLVVGLVLISIPSALGRPTTELQDRLIGIAVWLVFALGLIVFIGSLLAVRNSLHEYTARGQSPPAFVRIGFATFLLATLGTAIIAMIGSLGLRNLRRRRKA